MSAGLIAGLVLIAAGAGLVLASLLAGRSSKRRRLRRVQGNSTAATPYSAPRYQRHGRRQ